MNSKHFARIATLLLLSLSLCAATSFAATHPLNAPQGMAVDSKGNLYVANYGGNQVLVYSPAYAQLTAKTISANVSGPSGVAIDPSGNIWVANSTGSTAGLGSITEYSAVGGQNTTRTITNGINSPYAIATDAIGDVWVQNNFSVVTVYPAFGSSPPSPIKTIPFTNPVTGIATHGMWAAFGGNNNISLQEISPLLTGVLSVYGIVPPAGFSLAYDTAGNLYSGNLGDTLTVTTASNNVTTQLVALSYFPYGIAVDSVRGRIYVSDSNGNKIYVYSTAGALLKTIQ